MSVCVRVRKRHCVLEQAYCCSWNITHSLLSSSSVSLFRAQISPHAPLNRQPFQPILPLFSHFPSLAENREDGRTGDGGERVPLKAACLFSGLHKFILITFRSWSRDGGIKSQSQNICGRYQQLHCAMSRKSIYHIQLFVASTLHFNR